jgi:hypothetical protein
MRTYKSGLVQPLVLATVLAAGFAVVWGVACLWVASAVDGAGPRPDPERLVFLADGTAAVVSGIWEIRDLDTNMLPSAEMRTCLQPVGLPAALHTPPWAEDVDWLDRLRTFEDDQHPPVIWHLVSDGRPGGSAYLVGYDSETKSRVGFIGTAGLRETEPPASERFPFSGVSDALRTRVHSAVAYQGGGVHYPMPVRTGPAGGVPDWCFFVQTDDHKLYEVNLGTRSVRVALDDPGLRSSAMVSRWTHFPDAGIQAVAVRTDTEVLLLTAGGTVQGRYRIPEQLREQDFQWAETGRGQAVITTSHTPDERAPETEYRICWVDADGRCTRRVETTLPSHVPQVDFGVLAGVLLPSPTLAAGYVGLVRPWEVLADRRESTYVAALTRCMGRFIPTLVLAHVVGAGLAVLCYRRQRRYATGRSERVVWPVFVFLFGLPGWVGYRYGPSWPALDACPACGRRVPQDREQCADCHADFPPPAPRGTEVFAA